MGKVAIATSYVYEIKLSLLWSTYVHVLFASSFDVQNQQNPLQCSNSGFQTDVEGLSKWIDVWS